ncbi:putative glycosyltransferase, partial [Drosera capensis]
MSHCTHSSSPVILLKRFIFLSVDRPLCLRSALFAGHGSLRRRRPMFSLNTRHLSIPLAGHLTRSGSAWLVDLLMEVSQSSQLGLMVIGTYKEGDLRIFHEGPLNNIYGIEGRFILEMEGKMMSHVDSSRFRGKNPDEAHLEDFSD